MPSMLSLHCRATVLPCRGLVGRTLAAAQGVGGWKGLRVYLILGDEGRGQTSLEKRCFVFVCLELLTEMSHVCDISGKVFVFRFSFASRTRMRGGRSLPASCSECRGSFSRAQYIGPRIPRIRAPNT